MGILIAGFVYNLIALGSTTASGDEDRTIRLSIAFSILLAAAGVAALIYFIDHVAKSIQAGHVLTAVSVELEESIERFLGDETPRAEHVHADWRPESAPVEAPAGRMGHVQAINWEPLMEWAVREDCLVQCRLEAGDFARSREAAFEVHGANPDGEALEELGGFLVIGEERTFDQDVEFGLYQLSEIAIRALSPGVNDPHTAMSAIDRLGEALGRFSSAEFPDPRRVDSKGVVRIVEKRRGFDDAMAACFDDIRRHAEGEVVVSIRLIMALAYAADVACRADRLDVIKSHGDMVLAAARRSTPEERDLDAVDQVHRELARRVEKRRVRLAADNEPLTPS